MSRYIASQRSATWRSGAVVVGGAHDASALADARHRGEDVEERRRSPCRARPMPRAAVSSSFVTAVVGSGTSSSPAELEGEVQVLLHHVARRTTTSSGCSSTNGPRYATIGEAITLREHHLDRLLARDAALLREQHALAEGEHLHGEAGG